MVNAGEERSAYILLVIEMLNIKTSGGESKVSLLQ